jgi:NitT/TauT family transport system substrate-binding protein
MLITGLPNAVRGLAALTILLGLATSASAADHVSLRLNWQMKGEFAPFIVAVKKGFFREQGLDVKIEEGSGGIAALKSVASGQNDFAYVPSVQLIEMVDAGLPVKAIATVVKMDAMAMVSLSDVALRTPKDLEGHTVEITPTSTFAEIWPAFAHKNNIDVSKVKIVHVTPGVRLNRLVTRKVDVLADIFMTNEYPMLQKQLGDDKLHTMLIGDWGFHLVGYTLATQTRTIAAKPDLVKRFNAAAAKAFKFTKEHPEEAAQIASAAYPKVLVQDITLHQIQELVKLLDRGEPKQPFAGSDEAWQQTLDIMAADTPGMKPKPVAEYYTNAFVPAE